MAARRMRMTTRRAPGCAWLVAALAFGTGCSGRSDSSAAAGELANAADEAIELDEPPLPEGTPLDRVLAQKAKKYAAGLVPDGEPFQGQLKQGQRSDHLLVLRGGHCYRVLGVAGAEVEDLDLFLYDPDGVQLQQDAAQDRYPVLGMQADICPGRSGAHRLQVHAYQGGGPYAVRAFRTP
jgi:hypothetical protein